MVLRGSGPYTVGAQDLHAPAAGHATGFSGRLFYPAKPNGFSWPLPWIGAGVNGIHHARGFAHFLFFWQKVKLTSPRTWKVVVMKELLALSSWLLGSVTRTGVRFNAPILASCPPMPVILFSHGLGGTRNVYSCLCSEWASQGYLVLAMEHSDGTASAAQVPSLSASGQLQLQWLYYQGISKDTHTLKMQHRVNELIAASDLLGALHAGTPPQHVYLTGVRQDCRDSFLRGRLDMSRIAVVGHSYGGATVAAAVSEHSRFGVGIAMDPWWGALDVSSLARTQWATQSPLLVLGSHDWNTPNPTTGKKSCDGDAQEQLLAAAVPRHSKGSTGTGGGALLCVVRHTTHQSYDDILAIFSEGPFKPILKAVRFQAKLPPADSLRINAWLTRHFITTHLPVAATASVTTSESPATTASAPEQEAANGLGGEDDPNAISDSSSASSGSGMALPGLLSAAATARDPALHASRDADLGTADVLTADLLAENAAAAQPAAAGQQMRPVQPVPLSEEHLAAYESYLGDKHLATLQLGPASKN